MQFGDILKQLRSEKKLNQIELAKILKISNSAISMYERNERLPELETFEAIADYFNVDMDFLKGKTDTKRNNPFSSFGSKLLEMDSSDADLIDTLREVIDMTFEEREKLKKYMRLIKSNLL